MRLWALLLHIAKIPSHRQTYSTPSMPALLAPNKCLGGCIGSPFARIEQVTTVERHHQTAIEKTLTKSKVYRSATATVALWDGLPAAVVARGLEREAVWQHEGGLGAHIPSEIIIARIVYRLTVDKILIAMELEIIEIGRRTEVEDAEELILQRHFQTCRKALGHIEMGLIHHAIRGTLVGDVLYHVVRWTIVGTQQQRMFRPRLKIIEREGMGILWGQFGISERDHRSVACIAERIELASPWTTQPARIVDLQLLALRKLKAKEEGGEKLEEVFLVRCVSQRRVTLLLPGPALCPHTPVFPAQSSHHTPFSPLCRGRGVEGMDVVAVRKIIVAG